MRSPEGRDFWSKLCIVKSIEPKEFVFISSAFEDKEGNPRLEMLHTVMFAGNNGKTKLTLHKEPVGT